MAATKKLREGYTTGTCAALAAKAAAKMLLQHMDVTKESIQTPKGKIVTVDIVDCTKKTDAVMCAVRKDAGDDPDVTDGILIYAQATRIAETEVCVDGGEGVGRVTKNGLSQQIGEAAINPVPKKQIIQAVQEVIEETDYSGGIQIVITVPQGAEIAKKTFNPRLGIVGGISILGTTGIVEPMSERALLESIQVEMKVVYASGVRHLILTPGNYGEDYVRDKLGLELTRAVKCSNYIGETIDYAVEMGFHSILLVGHVGKLIKLAAGIMNTHSHVADARMEILVAHSALQGANVETLSQVMACITTEEAIRILCEQPYYEQMCDSILKKVAYHLEQRCKDIAIGAVLFSNQWGLFGKTENADALITQARKEEAW